MNISNTPLFQSKRNILAEQLKDKTIKLFLLNLKDGTPLMKGHLDSLHLRDGVLYHQRIVDGNSHFQLVIPFGLRQTVLTVGHLGRSCSLQLAQDRFYWPKMYKDVENHVKNCPRCLRRKPMQPITHLVPIISSQQFELLCIDFLGLEPSKGGVENILVITDHFTKYSLLVPCRSTKAKPTAKVLFDLFINHYGSC